MKLGEIFRFEVEYQLRRLTTPAFAAVLVVLSIHMNQQLASGPRHINSPLTVASAAAIVGMFAMLVTAAMFVDAATRDVARGMHPILYTAPVRELEYLGGRFLGAFVVNALVMLAVPAGLMLALVAPNMAGPETSIPFDALAYLQPFLFFTLPNLFVTAAILFTVAALTRRALPSYCIAVAFGLAFIIAFELGQLLSGKELAAIIDPFGVTAIREHIRYWTPAEKDVLRMGVPGLLVWNRLLWMGLGAALLLVLHWRFRLAMPRGESWLRRRRAPAEVAVALPQVVATPIAARRSFGARTRMRQVIAVAASALREILFSRLFLAIAAGALLIAVVTAEQAGAAVFDTDVWPVTHLIASAVLGKQMSIVFVALVALYAGELVWRDRDARMHEISATAPLPGAVTLAGSWLALVAMMVLLQAAMMVGGLLIQASQEYYAFEPLLYVKILFGLTLPDHLLFAALALAVHVVVDQKYVGHLVVVLLFVFTQFADGFGIRHNLLIYASDPGWTYSDMNGFGPFIGPWAWFKLYWAAWALLLVTVATLFWVRGTERGVRQRLALARVRFTGATRRVIAVAAVLAASTGGFIFYNTNVLNAYPREGESEARSAAYERRYKRYEGMAQPRVTGATLRVEIFPERRAVDIRGSYRLLNTTRQEIASIHVVLDHGVRTHSVGFDRPATLALDDAEQRYRIYTLARPLQPGDSLRLRFAVAFAPRGFPNSGISTAVARNGAYFDRGWLPLVGYQPSFELSDAAERRKQRLPATAAVADDTAALGRRHGNPTEDVVDVDMTIGTASDQIAVTPGTLVREWREHGKRWFHYRTDAPIANAAPVLSARYAVREDQWTPAGGGQPVALRIYHHPTHTFNIDRLMRSMKASLDYMTSQFGPYQYRELRIVEFPRYASFARAHPHTIAFSEGGSFLTQVEPWDVDRPYFVTAHEAAHQWWGQEVSGADVKGSALLTESLAQYSAMMVLEKTYGPEHVRRFYDFQMDYYLGGRANATAPELPLLDMGKQNYLYYYKGAIAMYTLRQHIGEAALNGALRRYLDRYRNAPPPYPTSRDLYAELQAATPDSMQPLLRDLFEKVTLWDVRTDSVRTQPVADGGHRVTLHVDAAKAWVDTLGRETPAPMDDLVEIGVFAPDSAGVPAAPLYLRQHRIRRGKQAITVTVDRLPARAGIDPRARLIQRRTNDNVLTIEAPGGRAPRQARQAGVRPGTRHEAR